MAFNAKNLHYDKNEPSFLRKLKGEFSGLDGRHNVQIARPKKDRLKTEDDDEDDPVILDEQGERVEKADFERRMRGADGNDNQDGKEPVQDGKEENLGGNPGDRQHIAEIGSSANSKKRKVVKVVRDANEDGEEETMQKNKKGQEKKDEEESDPPKKRDAAVPKKKSKKIKLSFDDADG